MCVRIDKLPPTDHQSVLGGNRGYIQVKKGDTEREISCRLYISVHLHVAASTLFFRYK